MDGLLGPLVLVLDPRTGRPAWLPYSPALDSLWRWLRPMPITPRRIVRER